MRKVYVVVAYSGRTDEEIMQIRERLTALAAKVLDEKLELVLPTPGLGRVVSEIDAVLSSDVVILSKNYQYSMPSRLVSWSAECYVMDIYNESELYDMEKAQQQEESNESLSA